MGATQLTGKQVSDGSVQRQDLDVTNAGFAVIRKILAGIGISLSSSGVDAGTGDVTVSVTGTNYGTTTLDFGATPGTNVVVKTITGLTGITSDSNIRAWIMTESNANHNAYEHSTILAMEVSLSCGNIVVGTGFDITAATQLRLTGLVSCHYVWGK